MSPNIKLIVQVFDHKRLELLSVVIIFGNEMESKYKEKKDVESLKVIIEEHLPDYLKNSVTIVNCEMVDEVIYTN